MWAIIATWRMAFDGVKKGGELLQQGRPGSEGIEQAIKMVEDYPFFKSVGYGGLPNAEMDVELDAGYMDGNTMAIGAVAGIKDFANPISIAKDLSQYETSCILVGEGAERYASHHDFERKTMLTQRAKKVYEKKVSEVTQPLKPYAGHDTVGMVFLDQEHTVTAATSTSGLFMKKPGRIGDSPIVGSGFYADSEVGGATATGLGEDLMKGCISYEIVRLMKEGRTPQEACDEAVNALNDKLIRSRGKAGDLSVVALNNQGEFGVATNIDGFSFTVYREGGEPEVYLCHAENGKTTYEKPSQEWLDQYDVNHSEAAKI